MSPRGLAGSSLGLAGRTSLHLLRKRRLSAEGPARGEPRAARPSPERPGPANSLHLPLQQPSCSGFPGGALHLARTEPLTDGLPSQAQREGLRDGKRGGQEACGALSPQKQSGLVTQAQLPALPLPHCVILSELPNLSEPRLPRYPMGMTVTTHHPTGQLRWETGCCLLWKTPY